MLATYTPFEARVLEDHYIAMAKAEGIWGAGRPPLSAKDKERSREAGTAAGRARQARSEEKKRLVLQAIRQGDRTVSQIKNMLNLSDTCVRKYMRELERRGQAKVVGVCSMGSKTWRAVN